MEYKWVVLTVTTVGGFMGALGSSTIIIALPQILGNLNASLAEGVWMIALYQLAVTVLALGFGRIADRYGRVKVYTIGFSIFALGTWLSAVAMSGLQLILFRGVQGAGAALIFVNGISLAAEAFPPSELGKAIGINFMAFSIGSVTGYSFGGAIVTLLGWRAIFLIIGAVAVFGTFWSHQRLREIAPRHDTHWDPVGTVVYTLCLTMIVVGLTPGTTTASVSLMLLTAGALFFGFFILIERRQPHPVLDPKLFRNRLFVLGNIASLLTYVPASAFPLVVSLYLQLVRGLNPLNVGLILLIGEAAFAILTLLSGILSDRYGSRIFTVTGSILIFSSLILFALVDRTSPLALILGILALSGIGRGLFGSSNAASAMSTIQLEDFGIANGFRITVNNTAFVLSIPLVTALMTLVLPYQRAVQLVTGAAFQNETEILSFVQAISFSIIILAILALIAVLPDMSAKSKPTVAGSPS